MVNDLGIVESNGYELLEAKDHDAVVHGIVNLGLRPVEFQGEKKNPAVFIKVILELPDVIREDNETAVIGKKVKLTNSVDKGNYAKLLTAFGEKVTKINMSSYLNSEALKKLLGKPIIARIDHWESEEGTRAAVRELVKLDPRLPQPQATRATFFFNPLAPDLEVFKNTLTYFTQKEIMEALNADSFPKELHLEWVKIQEDKAKDASAKLDKNVKTTDTSAIE